jgi:hypothetical protein
MIFKCNMPPRHQLVGQRFGRLLVVASFGAPKHSGEAFSAWLCHCDCGEEIIIRGYSLKRGITKSCGCLRDEMSLERARRMGSTHGWQAKHGHARRQKRTRTYTSWMAMHERCRNSKLKKWKVYGGRGITVCSRWSGEHGFENFLSDMGERPTGKTLDRFPNGDGNYEPGNTRWATLSEQNNNRRKRVRRAKKA